MRAVWVVLMIGCGFAPTRAGSVGSDGNGGLPSEAGAADATLFLDAAPCPDDDGDGVCNAVDTWPCGPAPAALGSQLAMITNGTATQFTITAIDINAQGRLVVAPPNTTVSVHLHYAITDTACAGGCIDQLEIGWAPGNRTSCPFDANVPNPQGSTGNISNATIKLPATPGSYDIRANIGQNYACTYQGANTWWGGAPGATQTLAKVCVH